MQKEKSAISSFMFIIDFTIAEKKTKWDVRKRKRVRRERKRQIDLLLCTRMLYYNLSFFFSLVQLTLSIEKVIESYLFVE
jgi:hypothetical protein